MKLLGIDYGRAKVGIALAEGFLSDPLVTIRVSSFQDALVKVKEITEKEKPDQIVVGISEGVMGEEQMQFVRKLAKIVTIPVNVWDEGLSTRDAQRLSLEAGISRTKRQKLEDAFAAAVMLQSYLDSINSKS